jgi:hypothetical protein
LRWNWASQERISAELRRPAMLSGIRKVKVAIVNWGTIAPSGRSFGLGSEYSVVDISFEVLRAVVDLIGEGLGDLDSWCSRKFGRSLSGRLYKLEIQTLFHGNTRDQDQI